MELEEIKNAVIQSNARLVELQKPRPGFMEWHVWIIDVIEKLRAAPHQPHRRIER